MRPKDLIALGVPRGEPLEAAVTGARNAAREWGMKKGALRKAITRVVADPAGAIDDPLFGDLARALVDREEAKGSFVPRGQPAPWRQWGTDLEPGAVTQMVNAVSLPVAFRGALMPDAHLGYGLPIGGVLATEGAVIPYAVGMDIGCRMRLSLLDLPLAHLERKRRDLVRAIDRETRFGVGARFERRRDHPVMGEDWKVSPVTAANRDVAWEQLGTSGAGNHFVEFGVLGVAGGALGVEPGRYLALMSHSGARGTGAKVATHYSRLAMKARPQLPRELMHLAWLSTGESAGAEYWAAMELMGRYSAANHELIHEGIASQLGAEIVAGVENHHNFAWREEHFGRRVVVHRKGATPAKEGTLGVIPGSMATPAYVVRGLGEPESMRSAAHGAGRRMSRNAAKARYTWGDAKRVLDRAGVHLITASLDEVPMAYKDIDAVMAAQRDLVEIVARFEPRLVKMAD